MGILAHRFRTIRDYLHERRTYGVDFICHGRPDEVVFLLDGVGGTLFGPLMMRRALREAGYTGTTVIFNWHRGLWGNAAGDLMNLRHNRYMAVRLARQIRAYRRDHPDACIHIVGFSGGTGIAVFALEILSARRHTVDSVVLIGPALQPEYNLAPALWAVRRSYALISDRDTVILGLGTRILGTIDRHRCVSAGCVGFRLPPGAAESDIRVYDRLFQIHWKPRLHELGHYGGHTGWMATPFLTSHLPGLLAGTPTLPVHRGAL